MAQPTLDDLYHRLGVQRAEYIDDYLSEREGHAVACIQCGGLMVAEDKTARWRCAACRVSLPRKGEEGYQPRRDG